LGVVCFRIDLGSAVGGGHLARCKKLANSIRNYKKYFFIRQVGDLDVSVLDIDNYYLINEEVSYLNEVNFIKKIVSNIDLLIVDFTNPYTLASISEISKYLKEIKHFSKNIILIDGAFSGSLAHFNSKLSVDKIISPYVGSRIQVEGAKLLLGEKYFILPVNRCQKLKTINNLKYKNVLITFGQSDPMHLTEWSIKAILRCNKLSRDIKFKVILGPLFSIERSRKIRILVSRSKSFSCLKSPPKMEKLYTWADYAISGTGLTKYELAHYQIPAILISSTAEESRLQVEYDKKRVALHLGSIGRLYQSYFQKQLVSLTDGIGLEKKMKRNCRNFIDGMGLERCILAIEE
jgi:UDP-2,4-diacetamido-2,4,6-trideoxy-beta-L-altropyranose hydrolase